MTNYTGCGSGCVQIGGRYGFW